VPIRLSQSGAFEIEYTFAPPLGLHVQAPENLIPDTASPSMSGVQLRNSELRSMPPFVLKFPSPDPINPFLGQFSFIDLNAVAHTVAWTSRGLWQLAGNNPPLASSWSILGGPAPNPSNPMAYRAFANVLYYTNGAPFMASWDGTTQAPTSTTTFGDASIAASVAGISKADSPTIIAGSTGPLAIGALFLAELDNHIILANVTVLDQLGVNAATSGAITPAGVIFNFPQRIWWSANGLPNVWDFAANTNAGENDFLDVPDQITGIITIGTAGYIFRSNGITQFIPTGNGIVPFQFDHLWASDHGVGNIYPWSITSYGAFACFVSAEQIYQMGVNSFSDIGGTARDAIMADLSQASGTPVGSIVPTEASGIVYLTYRISIPLTTFTRHYIYSFEGKYWEIRDTAGFLITGREEEIWTGQLSSFGIPGIVPPSTSNAGGSGGGGFQGGGGGGGGGTGQRGRGGLLA
jgi:hypothetical protein